MNTTRQDVVKTGPPPATCLRSINEWLDHFHTCGRCRENPDQLVDLAVEILLTLNRVNARESTINIVVIGDGNNQISRIQTPLFRDFVANRFEPDVMRHFKPSGRRGYGYTLQKHILPTLGVFRLGEITLSMVQDEIIGRMVEADYSVETMRHVRQVITAVYKHAVRTGDFAGTMPVFGLRMPALVRKTPRHALTFAQAKAVLNELDGTFRTMALLSMTTSMNIAEMCALRWKRVNLTARSRLCAGEVLPPRSLAVRENFYLGSFGTPKTSNRRRVVVLPRATVEALKELRRTTRFALPDDLVFATRNGTAYLGTNLRRQVTQPLRKKLGIPWLHWHCFRNTFATLGEQLGVALSDRQAQMGHGTVWMTQEYTVSEVERRRAGSERIARRIA